MMTIKRRHYGFFMRLLQLKVQKKVFILTHIDCLMEFVRL